MESHERSADSEGSRASVEMRHSHLPMLTDANVIEYNRGRDSIACRGDDQIEALLEFISERLE
ncbi:DUF7344 domain-containing protein [Halorubrum salsamenti]